MRTAVALILLLAGAAAHAAPPSPARQVCNPDRIRQTNAWVECLQKALAKAEAELDALVRRISGAMAASDMLEEPKRSENRRLFEETQRNWRALRDSDCASFAAHEAGLGFGAAQFRLVCLVDETLNRVQALKTRHADDLK
jgi:uncharacterized protein YecT (DUF1311 family)